MASKPKWDHTTNRANETLEDQPRGIAMADSQRPGPPKRDHGMIREGAKMVGHESWEPSSSDHDALHVPQNNVMNNQSKTVELFAGIGGFRVAADHLGLETIWANEISPRACAVYRDCFGDGELREGDIHGISSDVPKHDLLTAGFPCQPFSSAGKKQGLEDPRGTLFQSIVDILIRRSPRFFILENVKRLLHMDRGEHFATILSALAELDYSIEWRLLNSTCFGLPQNRQRVILIGSKTTFKQTQATPPIRLASTQDLRTLPLHILDHLSDSANMAPDRRSCDCVSFLGCCRGRQVYRLRYGPFFRSLP